MYCHMYCSIFKADLDDIFAYLIDYRTDFCAEKLDK